MKNLHTSKIFKAYDVRGIYPNELNPETASAIGKALALRFKPQRVIIGKDVRLSANALEAALKTGLASQNVKIFLYGLCATEEIYDASARHDYDLGIMITGSHNPADENGFKFILRGGIPLDEDDIPLHLASDVKRILSESNATSPEKAEVIHKSHRDEFVARLLRMTGFSRPSGSSSGNLSIIADAGNGCAGIVLERLIPNLPFNFIRKNFTPDGNFPHGVPNPLLENCRKQTSDAVRIEGADLAIAFDGDCDRCFFYDQDGNFIDGYYLVGLLAREMLKMNPGATIIHDPRVYWNTREVINRAGGRPVMSKTGHAFVKNAMRREQAIYGGEMSSHHYFREFAFCDSGFLTMLHILKYLSASGESLAETIHKMKLKYPISGELNFQVEEPHTVMASIWNRYSEKAIYMDKMDGINLEFPEWRFNLRCSNTQNLLRLNVESRANPALLHEMTEEISAICKSFTVED